MQCEYRPTGRTGLYLIVVTILIMLLYTAECPETKDQRRNEIIQKIEKLETKIDSLSINQKLMMEQIKDE